MSVCYLNEMDVVVRMRQLFQVGVSLPQLGDLLLQLPLQTFGLRHRGNLAVFHQHVRRLALFLYQLNEIFKDLITRLHRSLGTTLFT